MRENVWTDEEAHEALQSVVKRATTDPEFRKLALADPAAAILEATGKSLPEGYVVNLVENGGADLTVVLPDPVAAAEISDVELDAVVGGTSSEDSPAVRSKGLPC